MKGVDAPPATNTRLRAIDWDNATGAETKVVLTRVRSGESEEGGGAGGRWKAQGGGRRENHEKRS